jgi:hypothetical protein
MVVQDIRLGAKPQKCGIFFGGTSLKYILDLMRPPFQVGRWGGQSNNVTSWPVTRPAWGKQASFHLGRLPSICGSEDPMKRFTEP